MSLGIKGKYIVANDGVEHRMLRDGFVVIEGNRIKHVGKSYSGTVDHWIDASEGLVIPGMINTHIHAASAPKDKSFLEDVGARALYMSSMGENLSALGRSMTKADSEVFAKYSMAECLLSGNTTIMEIGMTGSLGTEKAIKLVDELGIRSCQGFGIADGYWKRTEGANIQTVWRGLDYGLERLERAAKYVEDYRGALNGRIIPSMYPDKVDVCSGDLQRAIREKANELKCPISIHGGQWVVEFQNMLRMYRRTPMEYLHDTGLLGPDLIIGHGWAIAGHPLLAYPSVGEGDLKILADAGATISHDPVVFAKRGNKMHSHSRYLAAGVNVSIGTDSSPQDILNEMRFASFSSKFADWDCHSGSSREIFNSATLGGAKGLQRYDLGRIAPGALADIAIVDMMCVNAVPVRDPIRNLVNCMNRSDVKTVIVDGEIVIEDGKLLTADLEKIVKDVQKSCEAIYERIPDNHVLGKTADEASPPSYRDWEE
jgi:cytosine/adenosine deaminase-related metal-dependent hydrolase